MISAMNETYCDVAWNATDTRKHLLKFDQWWLHMANLFQGVQILVYYFSFKIIRKY